MHIKNAIYANDRSLLCMFWIFRGGIALMNLNHLAIFQAVAAVNSVSGGARRLNISQSAVSKQLAEFERSVGVSLFQRLPRGMRLTEAGRMLQGFANRLFAIEAEAEHALRRSEEHTYELQSLMRNQ